ncbi:sarcosine oxidase subunit gamma [Rhizobiales bacterium GAS188]|nr:sarcosine oxidase subunit gamma [Rhizobiales bacterium GAS188]
MPDQAASRESAFEQLGVAPGEGALSVVAPKLLPPMTRIVFRGRISTIGRVAAAFGVEPAMESCRAAVSGERAALWLGPDEWLLIAEDGAAPMIMAQLDAALSPLPHSLVDVSHRQAGLKLAGDTAALMLSSGCPLDLQLSAFPVGMCTRTLLYKAEILLWRTEERAFHIDVARSFVPYLWGVLEQAERDL